ncbi:hypothetical protein M569_16628, partial [Genlisea aurea]
VIDSSLRRRTHLVQSFSVVFLYCGNSAIRSWGSEGESCKTEERKRKRMESNRESARRSRMRKQKHLDDLTAQVARLQEENGQILTDVTVVTQSFLNVEAENSVLRARMGELTQSLHCLSGILDSINSIGGGGGGGACNVEADEFLHDGGAWGFAGNNHHQHFPIMAAAEMMLDY